MKKIAKIFLSLILIIGIIGSFGYAYVYIKLKSIQVEDVPGTEDGWESGVTDESLIKGKRSILLIGGDTRNDESGTRSDAVMLVTLDTVNDNVKLISFARDAYVNIPKYGYQKLTHAYAYGAAPLLLQTVRENFGVDVDEYVAIDFESFIKVIDLIDGVPVEIEGISLSELNRVSKENYDKFYDQQAKPFESIDTDGAHTLNGYQALAYVRMRKTDSTFARDERQREVVENTFEKVLKLPISQYPQLFEEVLPYISTNIQPTRLISLGLTALSLGTDDIKQLEFPSQTFGVPTTLPGKGWVIQWNEKEGRALIKDFLSE